MSRLAFGATMGVLYGQLRRRLRLRFPPPIAGGLFGLAVWSGNYQTWAGILPRPAGIAPVARRR